MCGGCEGLADGQGGLPVVTPTVRLDCVGDSGCEAIEGTRVRQACLRRVKPTTVMGINRTMPSLFVVG